MPPDDPQNVEECLEWRRKCREEIMREISSTKSDIRSIKDEFKNTMKTNKRDISLLILAFNSALAIIIILIR